VSLVEHQSEHGLGEWISGNGRLRVEIGGRNVGLRCAEAMFVEIAEQGDCFGVPSLRRLRQLPRRAKLVATGNSRAPPRHRVRMRERRADDE
jgi:hypothetical protein